MDEELTPQKLFEFAKVMAEFEETIKSAKTNGNKAAMKLMKNITSIHSDMDAMMDLMVLKTTFDLCIELLERVVDAEKKVCEEMDDQIIQGGDD